MKVGKRQFARQAALYVVERLRAAGYTAYFAGGCVRDMLLGAVPKDYDVATDATPDRVQSAFRRSRRVGAKFGVVLVRQFGHDIEVATFRTDGDYLDGRHPEHVVFGTEHEDAVRRDFTINGMFFDPLEDRLIDHVGGQADLEARLIRTIGDPALRFAEDHLRMLRAVRFAARLDFAIHGETLAAIGEHAAKLGGISAERIWMELSEILAMPRRAAGVALLGESGLSRHLCDSWVVDAAPDSLGFARLSALPDETLHPTLALAALTAAMPEGDLNRIGRSLKLSNVDREETVWLVRSLSLVRAGDALELADLKTLLAHPRWSDLIRLVRADEEAPGGRAGVADALTRRAAGISADRIQPAPLLTGEDLHRLGVQPGPEFGRILGQVYRAQLNEAIGDKPDALAMARSLRAADR
jgi:hypothetical protein